MTDTNDPVIIRTAEQLQAVFGYSMVEALVLANAVIDLDRPLIRLTEIEHLHMDMQDPFSWLDEYATFEKVNWLQEGF